MSGRSPIERKLRYLDNLASEKGIELSMLRWEAILPEIYLSIGFNVFYRFLLDFHLCLSFHIPFPEFDATIIDKLLAPPYIEAPAVFVEVEVVEKAIYGKTKYGECVYDPEQLTNTSLENIIWDLRYKATSHDHPSWKLTSQAFLKFRDQIRKFLIDRGVADYYIDGILETLALVEGKVLDCGYWDMGVFDVSKFKEPTSTTATFQLRDPENWLEVKELETEAPYEAHWDFSRFDYARFYETGFRPSDAVLDYLDQKIRNFMKRSGTTSFEYEGVKYEMLNQRPFMLQRVEKYHWKGGEHQVKLQDLINRVKRLLNERGVPGNFRMAYISYAQQLCYLYYKGHRRYKRWRNILTPEELKDKYINMGCDKEILDLIEKEVL